MNTYNIAINYLMDKYGRKREYPTKSLRTKLDCTRYQKDRDKLHSEASDNDYVCTYVDNIPRDNGFDHQVLLLIAQYNYGSEPKEELKYLMKKIGLM